MAIGYGAPCPKPAKREKREKKARTRIRIKPTSKAERNQIAAVRQACVDRDGPCRASLHPLGSGWGLGGDRTEEWQACDGISEWAHMHSRRRSQTRNLAPEVRHDTAHSLMLCRGHHDAYDGRRHQRLIITALTRHGANGPLKFRRAK